MQQLVSNKGEEEFAIVTTANSCLSNNINLEKGGSLITVQVVFVKSHLRLADVLNSRMESPMIC